MKLTEMKMLDPKFRRRWYIDAPSGSHFDGSVANVMTVIGTHIIPLPIPWTMAAIATCDGGTLNSNVVIIAPLTPVSTVPISRASRGSTPPILLARKNPITIPTPRIPSNVPISESGYPFSVWSIGGSSVMGVKFSMPYTSTSTSPTT